MDEERQRTFTKLVMETLRKHYESVSAMIFFFFLLIFANFKLNMLAKGAKPLPLSLPRPFIAKIGEELAAPRRASDLLQKQLARPGELVASPLSHLVGPGAEECPKIDHFAPILSILLISF